MLCEGYECPRYYEGQCMETRKLVVAGEVCQVAKTFEEDVHNLLYGMNELMGGRE